MNKRARTRLIGITLIILIAVLAIVFSQGSDDAAYYKTVEQISEDKSLVGERVRVGGAVVQGSWDKKSNPMSFRIRAEEDADGTGPTLAVVYSGGVPSTFGDGVVAIVTGELGADGTIKSTDMITKCPSKYESATTALTVTNIKTMPNVTGKSVKVQGYIVAGSIVPPGGKKRFSVAVEKDGTGDTLDVFYEGAPPAGMTDGSQVVLGGSLDADGVFDAVSVAMSSTEKK